MRDERRRVALIVRVPVRLAQRHEILVPIELPNQLVFPGDPRIEVVDSQLVSLGMSFLVCAAAKAAVGGADVEEIKTMVEAMVPRVRILVVLDTLEYVRRGGRIGRARVFLGNMLRIKPLLYLRDKMNGSK